jgi:ATP-dependent DNA ligase
MKLPIAIPFAPMEAKISREMPVAQSHDPEWQYEPKWDGFRCIAFRDGNKVELQSKSGQPLTRYFPELVSALLALKARTFVLDGEIIVSVDGRLSFDDLLQRIHPAASRVEKLSHQTPAQLIVFDLLVDREGSALLSLPLQQRRKELEAFYAKYLAKNKSVELSLATHDLAVAKRWLETMRGQLDGIVAKRLDQPYMQGERAMLKVKTIRSADCVVGGFRYASAKRIVGSLLLGLYDEGGLLNHVGRWLGDAK